MPPNLLVIMTDEERYPPPYEDEATRRFRAADPERAGTSGQRTTPRRPRHQPHWTPSARRSG